MYLFMKKKRMGLPTIPWRCGCSFQEKNLNFSANLSRLPEGGSASYFCVVPSADRKKQS